MKRYKILITLFVLGSAFASCSKLVIEDPITEKKVVFEYFWKSVDEKYSFFELKDIDWDGVHDRFAPTISETMSDEAFFDTLSVMIDLLHDGHSGVTSTFNDHKYVGFFTRGPENFDARLLMDNYAHGWGAVKGALNHISLADGQVAYIYYGDFSSTITDADIEYLIEKYKDTKGIIIDVRNNFGGAVNNIFTLASHFANNKTLVMKSILKNGTGHNDFTGETETYLQPSVKNYAGKVCVLTNRKVFSAASVFTLVMRELPNVTVVGDTTGGGLGLPIGTEIPNGWQMHCSGSQLLSTGGECFEMGIPPDVQVDMKKSDMEKGIDTIIETAMQLILKEE